VSFWFVVVVVVVVDVRGGVGDASMHVRIRIGVDTAYVV